MAIAVGESVEVFAIVFGFVGRSDGLSVVNCVGIIVSSDEISSTGTELGELLSINSTSVDSASGKTGVTPEVSGEEAVGVLSLTSVGIVWGLEPLSPITTIDTMLPTKAAMITSDPTNNGL